VVYSLLIHIYLYRPLHNICDQDLILCWIAIPDLEEFLDENRLMGVIPYQVAIGLGAQSSKE